MSLLEVKGLRVVYRIGNRYVEALSGIDLEVRKGETLGLRVRAARKSPRWGYQ